MEAKVQQRLVGILVLAAFVLLIAPVLLDAEGRIPEKITNIPPQPKQPDTAALDSLPPPQVEQPPLPEPEQSTLVDTASAQIIPVSQEAPVASTRLWSVQVASFRDSVKAAALRDRLREDGLAVYTREKVLSDDSLFTQVFAGPVTSKSEAEALKQVIRDAVGEQGLIVRYRE